MTQYSSKFGSRRPKPPASGPHHTSPQPRPGNRTTRHGVTLTLAPHGDLPSRNHQPEPPLTTRPSRHEGAAPTRRTGDWPIPRSRPDLRIARLAEHQPKACSNRARFHIVLSTIQAMLEEQPSPRTVRSTSRRICNAITLLADDIETQMREAK